MTNKWHLIGATFLCQSFNYTVIKYSKFIRLVLRVKATYVLTHGENKLQHLNGSTVPVGDLFLVRLAMSLLKM
ncbi:hypothetical protein BCU23_16890 [Vibrio splendidus]|nr:hypothetical protein BCU23_16890 [Vibrio splendidus]